MIILYWSVALAIGAGILVGSLLLLVECLNVILWFAHTSCQILYGACENCFRPATKSIGGYDPYKVCKKHIRNYR
jgi:hypothetical protein